MLHFDHAALAATRSALLPGDGRHDARLLLLASLLLPAASTESGAEIEPNSTGSAELLDELEVHRR